MTGDRRSLRDAVATEAGVVGDARVDRLLMVMVMLTMMMKS